MYLGVFDTILLKQVCIGYNLISQKCITMQVSCTDIIAYIVSSVRKDLCRHLVCFRPIVFVQCRMYRIHLFCFFSVCHHGRLDPHPILGNCMLLSVENMWSFMLFLTVIGGIQLAKKRYTCL